MQKAQRNLMNVYKYLEGGNGKKGARLFLITPSVRTKRTKGMETT